MNKKAINEDQLEYFDQTTNEILIIQSLFQDQLQYFQKYDPIIFEAHLKLFDFEPFLKEMQNLCLTKDTEILKRLTIKTRDLAKSNLDLFKEIEESQVLMTKKQRCRIKDNDNRVWYPSTLAFERFDSSDTLQTFQNNQLAHFCSAVLDFLNTVIFNKQDTKKELTTYQWLTDPEKELPELSELYKRMNGKFIAETDFESFRAIFTGQPVQSITKLKWLAGSAMLAYFIDSIRNKMPLATDMWETAKHCFEKSKSLKQSQQSYLKNKINNGKPKKFKLIDELLTNL